MGVVDMKTGQAYAVQFVAGTTVPRQVKWCLGGHGKHGVVEKSEVEITANWFKQMIASGKLKVTLIGEFGAVGTPPAFRFQSNDTDKNASNHYVDSAYIKRAVK